MPDDGAMAVQAHQTQDAQKTALPHPDADHVAAGSHAHAPHAPPRRPRHLGTLGVALVILAAASAAWGIVSRAQSENRLATWTDQQAVPTVEVARPSTDAAFRALTLPGEVQAFSEAPIYARTSGYLHGWSQDIGAHVKAGQTLATIDTPDLDQELAQAEADLASARANAALADLSAQRWHNLLASNSVSRQSADERQGNAVSARAAVAGQQAHVDRLRAEKSFARLVAPFDGVVTARNTDIGALINAGASAQQPLFKVADIHAVRIYVRVPQLYASQLTAGMTASITQPQYPGQSFAARLVTTAQSAAAESRTVLVELMADNRLGKLWPGTYAEVKFQLPADRDALRVPASALIFRAPGAQLATLGTDHRLVMKPVVVGRNLGNDIEITAGISASDLVVTAPLDTLEDGQAVRMADGDSATGAHAKTAD